MYINPWQKSRYWYIIAVTGEANFVMQSTRLTIGVFTQPAVARSIIEQPTNADKGLSHRFMWLFPNPFYGKFNSLGTIQKEFQHNIGKKLHPMQAH